MKTHGPVGVCRQSLLVVLLVGLALPATGVAGNPISVEKGENSVTLRVRPLDLFKKKKKTPAAKSVQSAAAKGTNTVASAAPAVPQKPTVTSTAASTPSTPAAAGLAATAPATSVQQSSTGTDGFRRTYPAEPRYQWEPDWARARAIQQATREAQFRQNEYMGSVAGDLGAMGVPTW